MDAGRWSISSGGGLARIDERGRLMETDEERSMGLNLDDLASESDGGGAGQNHYHHTKSDSYEESQPLQQKKAEDR